MYTKNLLGKAPNQVPKNSDLGEMAYQNSDDVSIRGGYISPDVYGIEEGLDASATLNLEFEKELDPYLNFTRNSEATYFAGESVAGDENLWVYSQDFARWTNNTRVTIKYGAIEAPDGTMTASEIIEDVSESENAKWLRHIYAYASTPGVPNTISIYAKANTRSHLRINSPNYNDQGTAVVFDVANIEVTHINNDAVYRKGKEILPIITADIEDAGNGWRRLWVTWNAPEGSDAYVTSHDDESFYIYLQDGPSVEDVNYIGDGTSSIYLWGFQYERHERPGKYVHTHGRIENQPSQPILTTAKENEIRKEYDPKTGKFLGALFERTITNEITYSSEYDRGDWVLSNLSTQSNRVVTPSGYVDGYELTSTSANTSMSAVSYSHTFPNNQYHAVSCFVKKGKGDNYFFIKQDIFGTTYEENTTFFDLDAGEVITQGTNIRESVIQEVGNGWYRCGIAFDTRQSGTFDVHFGISSDETTGDAEVAIGDSFYMWGCQLELNDKMTSYVPSVHLKGVREYDTAEYDELYLRRVIDDYQGTFYLDFTLKGDNSDRYEDCEILKISTYRNSTYQYLRFRRADQSRKANIGVSYSRGLGYTIGNEFSNSLRGYVDYEWVFSYDGSKYSTMINELTGDAFDHLSQYFYRYNEENDFGAPMPKMNYMVINYPTSTTENNLRMDGHIRRIAYYPKKMNARQVQKLTEQYNG